MNFLKNLVNSLSMITLAGLIQATLLVLPYVLPVLQLTAIVANLQLINVVVLMLLVYSAYLRHKERKEDLAKMPE